LLARLDAAHDRAGFNSDSESLNRDLREQVSQDIHRRVAACFVALGGRAAHRCLLYLGVG
jgi:hypothetical protein